MRNTVLIDSGPLIALFDRGDSYHESVVDFLKRYRGNLLCTWPVLTEVSHILDFNLKVQIDFLKWVEMGGLEVYDISRNELADIVEMMQNYVNVPMDLADATLMYVAHKEHLKEIVSIDSDFDIYRTLKNGMLVNRLWM